MEGIQNKVAEGWNPADVRMSFFRKPITNKWPVKESVSLFQVYYYVRSREAMSVTEELQKIADHEKGRQFKGANFDYVTPSGEFTYCSDSSLVKHSGVLCMDLDYLGDRVEELFQKLVDEKTFKTLLLFRSPSGQGLKWFIHIDLSRCDHRTWFTAVRRYLMATYSLDEKQVDPMCSNPSRACYLGYDPAAYLMTELIEFF